MHLPKPFAQNHLLLSVRIAELSTSKAYSETENPHRGLIQHLIALGFRASVKVTRRVSNKDLGSGLGATKKLAHRKDWRYCYLASKLNSPRPLIINSGNNLIFFGSYKSQVRVRIKNKCRELNPWPRFNHTEKLLL